MIGLSLNPRQSESRGLVHAHIIQCNLSFNHSMKMTRGHVRIHSLAAAKADFGKPISLFTMSVSHFRPNYAQLHERFCSPDGLTTVAAPFYNVIVN